MTRTSDGSEVASWTTEYPTFSACLRHAANYFKMMQFDGRFPLSVNIIIKFVSTDLVVYDYHWYYDSPRHCLRKIPHKSK